MKPYRKTMAGVLHVDKLGRVTIPVQTRRLLGINEGEQVGYSVEDNKMAIFNKNKANTTTVDDVIRRLENSEDVTKEEYIQVCNIICKVMQLDIAK